jgi:uncharacterized protein YkwD
VLPASPLLAAVVLAATLAVPAAVPAARADVRAAPAAQCRGSNAQRTLCRMNLVRRAHGLRALSGDQRLHRAAREKAADLVAHHYFAHVSPAGQTLRARVAATGWMAGRQRWQIGENLAWGAGRQSTPEALVRAWLHSPPHRRILLSAGFRNVGIGLVPVTPFGAPGATLVADFGS